MVKAKVLAHINSILKSWNWGTMFGHSFRIGGASFYLAEGVSPEFVQAMEITRLRNLHMCVQTYHLKASTNIQLHWGRASSRVGITEAMLAACRKFATGDSALGKRQP
jgi:hypothetical protein